MGYFILYTIGLIGPFFMIKYREVIGDFIGEANWMRKIGGVYNVVIIVAVIIFCWTIAEITGTTSILFSPLKGMFPEFRRGVPEPL